jgi:hypothetical protein
MGETRQCMVKLKIIIPKAHKEKRFERKRKKHEKVQLQSLPSLGCQDQV